MRALSRFLLNPFDDPSISLERLEAFGTDHHQRLIANNRDGVFDERIAATGAALAALDGGVTAHLTQLGVRKSRKQSKARFRRDLRARTARVEAGLTGVFGPRSPEVRRAFPHGRRIFNRCPDDLLRVHLTTMHNAVTAHAAELPAYVAELSAATLAEWSAVYSESESASGAKAATEEQRRAARAALVREFFITLAFLISLFPGQPEKLPLYMQQHLLEKPSPRRKKETEPQQEDAAPPEPPALFD